MKSCFWLGAPVFSFRGRNSISETPISEENRNKTFFRVSKVPCAFIIDIACKTWFKPRNSFQKSPDIFLSFKEEDHWKESNEDLFKHGFSESPFKVHHKNTKKSGGLRARFRTTGQCLMPPNIKLEKNGWFVKTAQGICNC